MSARVPKRKDIHHDFPLRGGVSCCGCDAPLTGGWSSGKYKRYAYYFCRTKTCADYGKSIPRAKLEEDFVNILTRLRPTRRLIQIASAMFKDEWNRQAAQVAMINESLKEEIRAAERKIEKLAETVVEASNPARDRRL